jgi:hypothetical protein
LRQDRYFHYCRANHHVNPLEIAVMVKGGFSSTAVLDREGFHLKKRSFDWGNVIKISLETSNGMATSLLVLSEGRSGMASD